MITARANSLIKPWMVSALLCLTALFLCSVAECSAQDERFEFSLTWLGIEAGTSVMESMVDPEEGPMIVSTTRSADWLETFYPVEDRVVSRMISKASLLPRHYHIKTREGSHRKDREVTFMPDQGKAIYVDNIKDTTEEHEIPAVIYDPLSVFFYVRTLPLVVGETVFVPMFDSKRVWQVEVRVLSRERVKVPAGEFDTILIKPLLKSEGIFKRSGDVYIWLSDDERRIPVIIKSRVALSSVKAVLTGGVY